MKPSICLATACAIREASAPTVPFLSPTSPTDAPTAIAPVPMVAAARDQYFDLAREFKATMSIDCKPYFVGVWDTVSSVGWVENPLHLPYSSNNSDIAIGRHAISIDERRAFFRTNLWHPAQVGSDPGGPRDLKQIWFPGVHCDVGGGYPEMESGLSKIALEWMLTEAKSKGLLVDPAKEAEILPKSDTITHSAPDPHGKFHESLKGFWNIAEFIFKRHYNRNTTRDEHRMNLYRRRTIPPGSIIHPSVYQRGGYDKLLPDDAKPGM